MNRYTSLARMALLATTLLGASATIAATIPLTSSLTASDATQKGRLSRNGVPSDGTTPPVFPGIINPAVSYHFKPYTINVGADPFVVVDLENFSSANLFVAAYQSAYYVTNPSRTYLGDPGTSGTYFGTDALSFAFTAIPFSQVVLIVNETTPNAGLNVPYTFDVVQSFSDSNYSDYPGIDLSVLVGGQVIPEPSTLLLLAPLALVAGLKSRRRRPAAIAA